MKTYRSPGRKMLWTNDTGSSLAVDSLVNVNGTVGVLMNTTANGATGVLEVVNEHEVAATAAEAWPAGAHLFMNTTTRKLTADPVAGYPYVGPAPRAKAANATTAHVLLGRGGGAAGGASALDWQESVLDSLDFTAAEPAAPAVGARYLNTGAGASSETAQTVAANEVLEWNGVDWTRVRPTKGMALMTEDDLVIYVFTTSWVALGTPANLKDLTDGGNADALHVHAAAGISYYKAGTTTCDADVLAIPVTHSRVAKTIGADAEACTLANGVAGQILVVQVAAAGAGGGLATITPATATGFASATLQEANEGVVLRYVDDTVGWVLLGRIEPLEGTPPRGSVAVALDVLAIPVTHRSVAKTTGGDAEALTLANGTPGQRLNIALVADGGGDGTLTPATATGWATIVFADAGDIVDLEYVDDTVGWIIVGSAGVAAPPVITV